jgi:hypothetical protein
MVSELPLLTKESDVSMFSDIGQFIKINECNLFVTYNTICFKDAARIMVELGDWRIASIRDIEKYQKEIREILNDETDKSMDMNVWVSDLIELETGPLNIPKYYSCDMRLGSPKNGSIALHEQCYIGLFFSGVKCDYEEQTLPLFDDDDETPVGHGNLDWLISVLRPK